MEEISVKGENYVKASSIARELGYTSDYVGQLCRSKQVEATLVGRSWYVKEASIRGHKEARYRSTSTKSKSEITKALGSLRNRSNGPNYLKSVQPRLDYETDLAPLYPTIAKEQMAEISSKSKTVRIGVPKDHRDNSDIKVSVALRKVESESKAHTGVISARYNRPEGSRALNLVDLRVNKSFTSSSRHLVYSLAIFVLILSLSLLLGSIVIEQKWSVGDGEQKESYQVDFNAIENYISKLLNKAFLFTREF